MRRVPSVILLAALALGGCGGSGASAPAASSSTVAPGGGPPCGPLHAVTLASGPQARVYVAGGRVFGCARGSAPSYELGWSGTCLGHDGAGPAAVSGVLSAYALKRCGVDTGASRVVLRHLSDGRTLAEVPAFSGHLPPESYVTVTALVLSPGGVPAWIAAGGSVISHRTVVQVDVLRGGSVRVLDGRPGVLAGVLELRGSTLRWRRGGAWQSAALG